MSIVLDKFLKYVSFDTQSAENEDGITPSTPGQWILAEELVNELQEMGAKEITFDRNHCYIYATIPATVENAPKICIMTGPGHIGTGAFTDGSMYRKNNQIYNTYIEHKNRVDVFYVAFSGGKDSVVALDLVQRAAKHR